MNYTNEINVNMSEFKKRNRLVLFIFTFLIMLTCSLFTINKASASATYNVKVYVFTQEGCSKCAGLKEYFKNYEKENVDIIYFEKANVAGSTANNIITKVREVYQIDRDGYPLTIIGGKFVLGYSDQRVKEIEQKIEYYQTKEHVNVISKIIQGAEIQNEWIEPDKEYEIPFIGKVKPTEVSLFLLSVVVGFADGLNPCGMWVLLFIISLLIPTQDKKKMWILGGGFILTSGIFYFLMMMSWIKIVEGFAGNKIFLIISGVIALAAGGWNLYKYIKSRINNEEGCDVTSADQKRKISKKVKKVVNEGNIFLALFGVISVTLLVNLFELACSAGWPYIFTTILAQNELSFGAELFYILIYVLFFLIDDIIIFAIAVFTLRIKAVSNKLTKYSHLIGGLLMILFGILLIFFPDVLR